MINEIPDRVTRIDVLLLIFYSPLRTLKIAWWRACGKRLRARNQLRSAIAALPFAHQRWMERCGREDLALLSSTVGRTPNICVHVHIDSAGSNANIKSSLASAHLQSVGPCRILVTRGVGRSDEHFVGKPWLDVLPDFHETKIAGLCAALAKAQEIGATHLVSLPTDAILPRHALAAYAAAGLSASEWTNALLYGDQDEQGRGLTYSSVLPWLKPEWDPRMVLSQDYISNACALPVSPSMDCLERLGGNPPKSLYELVLHLTLIQDVPVCHVARVTMHTAQDAWLGAGTDRVDAVRRIVGGNARVEDGKFGTVRVQFPLPFPQPKVSIIVATRDRAELLRKCVDGLLRNTSYDNFEIVIVDNDSKEPEALAYLELVRNDDRVKVVLWPHPFNYSAINNYGVTFARGAYICLLNNDIEIIEDKWLTELVREASQPGVGAVGARLLYPDRSVQHAGVVVGLGNAAGHAHRALPDGEAGYFAQSLIVRGSSAVTGACVLVQKAHFDAVGGLDEDQLAVAYNDVDLCLKLRSAGLKNIYAPASVLIHHESKSRGPDFAPDQLDRYMGELAAFQQRWKTTSLIDPWHHPHLDRSSEVYRVGSQ